MNSHQRKKIAAAHHYRMPLGCAVRVYPYGRRGCYFDGIMAKHDKTKCIVNFEKPNYLTREANPVASTPFAWVTYNNVRPLAVNRVKPWWRKNVKVAK